MCCVEATLVEPRRGLRHPPGVGCCVRPAGRQGVMGPSADRQPQDLGEEDAERLRRAHGRLRKASQDLEAFTVPRRMRGRWDNAPVPDEAMNAARLELGAAYGALWAAYGELLGWPFP